MSLCIECKKFDCGQEVCIVGDDQRVQRQLCEFVYMCQSITLFHFDTVAEMYFFQYQYSSKRMFWNTRGTAARCSVGLWAELVLGSHQV